MAENEDRAKEVVERVDLAEGYMADAEFREEFETRQIRYLQATCQLLLALKVQNEMIIEMLARQQDFGA